MNGSAGTIALVETVHGDFDIRLGANDEVERGDDLFTAVVISLFTRRADPATSGPNGWWGDFFRAVPLGSRLHLLATAKLTNETIRRAELFTREALAWLVQDGVAARVDVEVARNGKHRVDIRVVITKKDGDQWEHVWSQVRFSSL